CQTLPPGRTLRESLLPMRTSISRRTALKSLAGVAAVASLPRAHAADAAKKSAAPAPSGTINQSVCKWCFKDIPLEQFAPAAKAMGLQSVELLNPEDFSTLKKNGLICAMVSNPTRNTP